MEEEGSARGLSGSTVGHYRIESLIGKGGMGEVYLASDLKLRRKVAIKALPESLAGEASARARFVRECRLACKVVHPYVATVFDVIEHAERPLIVMERIEGSRLDQWVRATAPKPESLAALGLEIAEALAAIHRAGIVHRDLKPGNVMVTPDGHVKVTDFGVSLPLPGLRDDLGTVAADEAESVTRTGMGVGTVAYMSPEQVRGERLDGRSDLFSLGIVLYEAVTGEHPFRRESLLGTASAILHDPPSGGREHPTLTGSGPFRDVILRLLQKNPALRYASAEDLAADLRAVLQGKGISPKPHRPIPWTRVSMAALAVAVVAAVGWWLVTRDGNGGGGGATVPRPVIAVLPFEDETDQADGPSKAAMVADLLGRTLGQTRQLRAVDPDRLADVLGGLSSRDGAMERIATHLPVAWIAAGRIYREGENWLAAIDVFRPGTPEPVESLRVEGSTATVLADMAASRILGSLFPDGGRSNGVPRGAGWGSENDDAEASFRDALAARRELRLAEALLLLERAVDLDRDFHLARIEWAATLDGAGYQGRARGIAAEAKREAEAETGPSADRLRLLAVAVDARVREDLDAERRARAEFADRTTDDPVGHLALAAVERRLGRWEEAKAALDRAERLDAKDPRIPLARGRLDLARRDFSTADAHVVRAVETFRDLSSTIGTAIALKLRGEIAFFGGKYDDAERWYSDAAEACRAGGLTDLSLSFRTGIADVQLARGALREAEPIYRESIAAARRLGDLRSVVVSLGNLGGALYSAGDHVAAESVLREAVAEGRSIRNPGITTGALVNLASLLGYQGRTAESKSIAEEALRVARETRDARRESMALLFLADAEFQQGLFRESDAHYAELLAAKRKANAPPRELGQTLFAYSWVLGSLGRTDEAMRVVDEALEIHRRLGEKVTIAYALVVRADLFAQWADWEAAAKDLAEARAIAKGLQSPDADLFAHADLAEARMELMRGRSAEARKLLDPVLTGRGGTLATTVVAGALATSCEAWLGEGNVERARADAGKVLESATAMEIDRLRARVCDSVAIAVTDPRVAAEAGRIALDHAERGGLDWLAARAAATATDPATRSRGLSALDAYVQAAPDARRWVIAARPDVVRVRTALKRRG